MSFSKFEKQGGRPSSPSGVNWRELVQKLEELRREVEKVEEFNDNVKSWKERRIVETNWRDGSMYGVPMEGTTDTGRPPTPEDGGLISTHRRVGAIDLSMDALVDIWKNLDEESRKKFGMSTIDEIYERNALAKPKWQSQAGPFDLFKGNLNVSMSDEAMALGTDLLKAVSTLATSLPEAGFAQSVQSVVDDAASKAENLLTKSTACIPLCLALVYVTLRFFKEPSKTDAAIVVALSGALAIMGSPSLRSWCVEVCVSIREWFTSPTLSSQNGGVGFQDVLKLVTGVFTFATVNQAPDHKKLKAFVDGIAIMPRFCQGMELVMKHTIDIFERIINFIRDKVLGLGPLKLVADADPKVAAWMERVADINYRVHRGEFSIDMDNADVLFGLVAEGNKLISDLSGSRDARVAQESLRIHMNLLKRVQVPFDQANLAGYGTRVVPLMIMLRGPSGTGKSSATIPLLNEILAATLPEEKLESFSRNHMDHIYARQPEHGFWDGYHNQFACVFDDFGQARDIAGTPDNEFMDMIRAGNLFPDTLHMASLESKGNVNFTSKVILATTNLQTITPQSINESEAVARRFDLVYTVVPKVEFCTDSTMNLPIWSRRLDVKKAPLVWSKDVYDFFPHEFKSGITSAEPLSYDEVAARCISAFSSHHDRGLKYESRVFDLKREAILRRTDFGVGKMVSQAGMDCDDCSFEDMLNDEAFVDAREMSLSEYKALLLTAPRDFMNTSGKEASQCVGRWWRSLDLDEKAPYVDAYLRNFRGFSITPLQFLVRCYTTNPFIVGDFINTGWNWSVYFSSWLDTPAAHAFATHVEYVSPSVSLPVAVLRLSRDRCLSWFSQLKKRFDAIVAAHPAFVILAKAVAAIAVVFATARGAWMLVGKLGGGEDADCDTIKMSSDGVEWPSDPLPGDKDTTDDTDLVFQGSDGNLRGLKHGSRVRVKGRAAKVVAANEFHTEAGDDVSGDDILNMILTKSTYTLKFPNGIVLGIVTFVSGRVAIMPSHFVHLIRAKINAGLLSPSSDMLLVKGVSGVKHLLSASFFVENRFVDVAGRDMVCFQAPSKLPLHKDITKFFLGREQAGLVRDFPIKLSVVRGGSVNFAYAPRAVVVTDNVVKNSTMGEITISRGYAYDFPTTSGDCGSLLALVDSGSRAGKILGFHVAGSHYKGMSSALDREDVVMAISSAETLAGALAVKSTPNVCAPDTMASQHGDGPFGLPFEIIRESPLHVRQVERSKIIRSPLYRAWGPALTRPAMLGSQPDKGQGKIEPMKNALSKYIPKVKDLDVEVLGLAADSYWSRLCKGIGVSSVAPRCYSFREAVAGIPGQDFCDSIPRQTSAGFPYCAQPKPGFPGKTWFFGGGDEYDFEREQCRDLEIQVQEILDKASQGIRSEHIFVDFLKDERRPLAKVDAGKTRLISAAPLALSIATRMMFLDFSISIMKSRVVNGCAVGVNPYSAEWELMARMLESKGDKYLAGDFSNHDGSLSVEQLKSTLSIVESYYYNATPEEVLCRRTLFFELYDSKHINGSTIYQWRGCLPSGHPLTTIVNSLCNQINFRVAWYMANGNDVSSFANFDDHIELMVYGDDNLACMDDFAAEVFTPGVVTGNLKELGMTYTNPAKDGVNDHFQDEDKVSLLKRTFRFEPLIGRRVAPLELAVVLEMPYWTRKGSRSVSITEDTLDTAIGELSLHGERIYRAHAPRMLRAARERLGYCPRITDWAHVLLVTSQREDFW